MYSTIISNDILTNRRHRNMDEGAMYNNKYNYALRWFFVFFHDLTGII